MIYMTSTLRIQKIIKKYLSIVDKNHYEKKTWWKKDQIAMCLYPQWMRIRVYICHSKDVSWNGDLKYMYHFYWY